MRGFTRRFTTRVHRCDTVRAERAGRLGATPELRDSGSLKTASERVHRRRPGFVSGVRQTPLPNRLGADHWISHAGDASSARAAERSFFRAAKREPRADRLDRHGRTDDRRSSRRGFRRGFTRRFTTRVHRCDTVRAERAGRLGATSELRDGDGLKTASERVPSSPARFRLRRTADPVAQPIGRGPLD